MENHAGVDETVEATEQVSFDRYEFIGLFMLMYGWWKLLEHSWVTAIFLVGIGWLLAFATGERRETFIRVVSGVSADVIKVARSVVQKVLGYIADKKKDQSGNDGKS